MLCARRPCYQNQLIAVAVIAVLAGCVREDEDALRTRLEQWFTLGDTQSFATGSDCAVGIYQLRGDTIGAAMPVAQSVPQMLRILPRKDVAALDDPEQAPDAALVEAVNSQRSTGMAMRRAALEARMCMDDLMEAEFRLALTTPSSVLAFDPGHDAIMLLNPVRGVLIVAIGAG